MHEIKEECRRQEEQAAEFNVQWQGRVDALMEKLKKYFAPKVHIEGAGHDEDGIAIGG